MLLYELIVFAIFADGITIDSSCYSTLFAPIVQWIEWKIPVLQIRVRFPMGVRVGENSFSWAFLLFFLLKERDINAINWIP